MGVYVHEYTRVHVQTHTRVHVPTGAYAHTWKRRGGCDRDTAGPGAQAGALGLSGAKSPALSP